MTRVGAIYLDNARVIGDINVGEEESYELGGLMPDMWGEGGGIGANGAGGGGSSGRGGGTGDRHESGPHHHRTTPWHRSGSRQRHTADHHKHRALHPHSAPHGDTPHTPHHLWHRHHVPAEERDEHDDKPRPHLEPPARDEHDERRVPSQHDEHDDVVRHTDEQQKAKRDEEQRKRDDKENERVAEGGAEASVPKTAPEGESKDGHKPSLMAVDRARERAGTGPVLKGSAYLKEERKPRANEMNANPALKNEFLGMLRKESGESLNGMIATAEVFFSRSKMVGNTAYEELHSGFYSTVKNGLARGAGGPGGLAERAFNAAVGGSNLTQGRTDQGTGPYMRHGVWHAGDPNWQGPGRVPVEGTNEIYNFWTGDRGGRHFSHEDSRRFAEQQQRKVAEGGTVDIGDRGFNRRSAGTVTSATAPIIGPGGSAGSIRMAEHVAWQGGRPGHGRPGGNALQEVLAYAGSKAGVITEVGAGLEAGHHRHQPNVGPGGPMGAHDVQLRDPKDGHLLDMRDPADRQRMSRYVEAAVSAGATGVGADVGYMGPHGIHVGSGPAATWGTGGHGPGPQWLQQAFARGQATPITPSMRSAAVASLRKDARQRTATKLEPAARDEHGE